MSSAAPHLRDAGTQALLYITENKKLLKSRHCRTEDQYIQLLNVQAC
jgi:hypothetical protein